MIRIAVFVLLLTPARMAAQATASHILSASEVSSIFTDSVKQALKIQYPIRRVYRYDDRSGRYFCVLAESLDTIPGDKEGEYDTLHHAIKAINFQSVAGALKEVWEINDVILGKPNFETSIWFWTRYVEFRDDDHDGLIDPILVYGTSSTDDINGPRLKLIICYKGKKYVIRHHDSDLDEGRRTIFEKSFFSLPQPVKARVKAILLQINKDNNSIIDDIKF